MDYGTRKLDAASSISQIIPIFSLINLISPIDIYFIISIIIYI